MASFIGLLRRCWAIDHPQEPPKSADAIRIGLFGASWIAYVSVLILANGLNADNQFNRPNAVITPAKSHPEVIIAAVAARDRKRGEAYAKKHKIPIVHGSYQGRNSEFEDAIFLKLISFQSRLTSYRNA